MAPEPNANAVVLDGVELRLGTQDFHFDCAIRSGAVTAIAGPSGSGNRRFSISLPALNGRCGDGC